MYKEIQTGAVAKSYMRKGLLICEKMSKYLVIVDEKKIKFSSYTCIKKFRRERLQSHI